MGKKKFEEIEYDPIEAEAKRSLARQVSSLGVVPSVPTKPPSNTALPESHSEKVRVLLPDRKQKKRSFSCPNADQDFELDRFLLRIEEHARTHVPFQVLMRAACTAMMKAEDQIMLEMKKTPPIPCPATFAHAQYAEFEEYWTETITKAMRRSRPVN